MAAGRRRRPTSGDAGAALVEAAVVLTLVMVLISGVVGVSSASSAAAGLERAASAALRDATSLRHASPDLAVLARVAAYVASQPSLELDRVVVFNAIAGAPAVPDECADLPVDGSGPAGITGVCNVFGPAHIAGLADQMAQPHGCGPQSWERWWCPSQRRRTRPDPDRVGVHVEVVHAPGPLLVVVPGVDRLSATAVATLDPDDHRGG